MSGINFQAACASGLKLYCVLTNESGSQFYLDGSYGTTYPEILDELWPDNAFPLNEIYTSAGATVTGLYYCSPPTVGLGYATFYLQLGAEPAITDLILNESPIQFTAGATLTIPNPPANYFPAPITQPIPATPPQFAPQYDSLAQ